MFGGCDVIRPQAEQDLDVEWICVTDDPELDVPAPFQRRVVEVAAGGWPAANLVAKRFKLMPWIVSDCDKILWIDANMEVTSAAFVREALACLHDGIALFRHPRRDCVYDEAEATLGPEAQGGKYAGLPIAEQVGSYRRLGYPERAGLWACGVIAWDMADPRAHRLGREWLEEIERWTVQDQLSLPVVLRRLGLEPGAFPGEILEEEHRTLQYLGNRWLRIWPHLSPAPATAKSEVRETVAAPQVNSLSPVEPSENTARVRLRRLAGKVARRGAARFGLQLVGADRQVLPPGAYDVVERNYYSPVPDLERLPADVWDRRSELGGVDLRVDAAIELIEGELRPFVAELDVPQEGPAPPGEFFLRNDNYESVDAELLYAMIRARKPGRVLELGSGFTTLLIGRAARCNAADGVPTEHVAYDPFPRAQILGDHPPPPTRFEALPATEVPLEDFRRLEAGDVLFVDTTHTVKLASDVNFLVLDVLPELAPGVIVHFHDIFLPWEYPRVWFEQMQYYWAEQYLLQAFLAFNDSFEVLIPAQAVAREHRERLAAVIPSASPQTSPGAFWLVRREAPGSRDSLR